MRLNQVKVRQEFDGKVLVIIGKISGVKYT